MASEINHPRILDTSRSCGNEYQSDTNRQVVLENTVKKKNWSSQVLQARLAPSTDAERFDFNNLYSKLRTDLSSITEILDMQRGDYLESTNQSFLGAPI